MKVAIGVKLMLIGVLGLLIEFIIWVNDIWLTVATVFGLCILGGALVMASLGAEEEKEKLIDRGSFAKYVEEEGEENGMPN